MMAHVHFVAHTDIVNIRILNELKTPQLNPSPVKLCLSLQLQDISTKDVMENSVVYFLLENGYDEIAIPTP